MKKTISLITILLLLLSTFGCSKDSNQDKLVLKFSIVENEEHPQGKMVATFKEEIEKISNGQIECQAYYNGSLLSQDAQYQAVANGELEMTVMNMPGVQEYYSPAAVLCSTFLFDDYEHMRSVVDGEIGQMIFEDMLSESPFIPIGYFYNGTRQLNLRSEDPINIPEDLSETILRMPNGNLWVAVGESLGANVVGMAYGEVYTALQNGTIDAQDNPLAADKTMKFYEVTKQICMTSHIIDLEIVAFNTDLWKSLTEQQQEWIKEAMQAAVKVCDESNLQMESELIDFFKDNGIIITYPDRQAFIDYSYNYYLNNGYTNDWDMNIYNKIREMAK